MPSKTHALRRVRPALKARAIFTLQTARMGPARASQPDEAGYKAMADAADLSIADLSIFASRKK
jgi:hypothetical protein